MRQALQLSRLGKHRAAAVLAARATEAPDAEWGGDPASLPSTARWAELQYLTALQVRLWHAGPLTVQVSACTPHG